MLVEGGGTGYLKTACDHVHLNPVRARLLQREERLPGYPWSSLMWYLAVPKHRPAWMRIDRLLGEHGIRRDNGAGRAELERHLATPAGAARFHACFGNAVRGVAGGADDQARFGHGAFLYQTLLI